MYRSILATALAIAATGPAHALSIYPANGHQYEFVGTNLSWQNALAAAAAAPAIAGYEAHLVTITSSGEDDFVKALTGGAAFVWAAGTDEALEGTWKWAAGPEAGETFFILGGPVVGYSNWNAGEPNDSGTENYLHFKANAGNWNDIPANFGSGGYVIEYSLIDVIETPAPVGMALITGLGLAGIALRRRTARAA